MPALFAGRLSSTPGSGAARCGSAKTLEKKTRVSQEKKNLPRGGTVPVVAQCLHPDPTNRLAENPEPPWIRNPGSRPDSNRGVCLHTGNGRHHDPSHHASRTFFPANSRGLADFEFAKRGD